MYVCTSNSMYVCMYVCLYVCIYNIVYMNECTSMDECVCMNMYGNKDVRMHGCKNRWMDEQMDGCKDAWM